MVDFSLSLVQGLFSSLASQLFFKSHYHSAITYTDYNFHQHAASLTLQKIFYHQRYLLPFSYKSGQTFHFSSDYAQKLNNLLKSSIAPHLSTFTQLNSACGSLPIAHSLVRFLKSIHNLKTKKHTFLWISFSYFYKYFLPI